MSITCRHLAASSVLTTKYRIAACELQFFIHHQLQNQKSHCYKWEKTACQMPCAIQMAEWLCYCQGKWESLAAKESGYWDDALDPRVTYIPRSGGPNRLSLLALISGKWEISPCDTHSCDYYFFFHLVFLQDVYQEWRSDLGLASFDPQIQSTCSLKSDAAIRSISQTKLSQSICSWDLQNMNTASMSTGMYTNTVYTFLFKHASHLYLALATMKPRWMVSLIPRRVLRIVNLGDPIGTAAPAMSGEAMSGGSEGRSPYLSDQTKGQQAK